jgi:rRNA maturation endonuclease Nob1
MPLSYTEDRPDHLNQRCWGCKTILTRRLLSRDGLCPSCDSDAWDTVDDRLEEMRIQEDYPR